MPATQLRKRYLQHLNSKEAVKSRHLGASTPYQLVKVDNRPANGRAGIWQSADPPHLNQAIKHLGHHSVYAIGPDGSDRDVRFRALGRKIAASQ
jgi:hypothetical protein